MDAPPTESHGKLVRVHPQGQFEFHLVFSNSASTRSHASALATH